MLVLNTVLPEGLPGPQNLSRDFRGAAKTSKPVLGIGSCHFNRHKDKGGGSDHSTEIGEYKQRQSRGAWEGGLKDKQARGCISDAETI